MFDNLFDVSEKTILVTGGSSGIGLAAVKALSSRGAKVLIVSRSKSRTESAIAELKKEGLDGIGYILCDISNKDDVAALEEEIREIAKKHNLPVANKPDSEDICFIPDGDYKKFLEENSDISSKKGNIVNKNGEILGEHTGLYKYTIGQRKGLGISYKVPLFVIGFNKNKNELIVGEEKELYSKSLIATDINLLLYESLSVAFSDANESFSYAVFSSLLAFIYLVASPFDVGKASDAS